jgi:hypothetical protein
VNEMSAPRTVSFRTASRYNNVNMATSIQEIGRKRKTFFRASVALVERKDIFTMLLVILVGVASFGLGRLSVTDGKGTVEVLPPLSTPSEALGAQQTSVPTTSALSASVGSATTAAGKFVASKSGTKYHYPWCSGAKRIKDENKVWFNTVEEARAAGYTPAANCPGLD